MSAGCWIKFAMMVGDGKPELARLVEIAECYAETDSDTHKYNGKNLRKFHANRVAKGYKNSNREVLLKEKPHEHGATASSGSTSAAR